MDVTTGEITPYLLAVDVGDEIAAIDLGLRRHVDRLPDTCDLEDAAPDRTTRRVVTEQPVTHPRPRSVASIYGRRQLYDCRW